MTIKEALSFRKERLETVAKCYKNESLAVCMERIVKAEVHRLVVVDQDEHVIGVLSLSDLLHYIVIRPTKVAAAAVVAASPSNLPIPTISISAEDEEPAAEASE
jgi:Mg2+/Co2+ transporter CorC